MPAWRYGLGHDCRIVVPDDLGHWPAKQISHQSRQPIEVIFRRAKFDRDVLALDEARFLQALAERGYEARRVGKRCAAEKPNHRHRTLLRARRHRPSRRSGAEKGDDISPVQPASPDLTSWNGRIGFCDRQLHEDVPAWPHDACGGRQDVAAINISRSVRLCRT